MTNPSTLWYFPSPWLEDRCALGGIRRSARKLAEPMSVGAESLVLEAEASADLIELVPGDIVARSPLQLFWRRFRSDRVALVSLGFIVILILVALLANPIVSLFGVS